MKRTLQVLALSYILLNLIAFSVGAAQGNAPKFLSNCQNKPVRAEKLFPAYRLGCYLFSTEE
jgi:hypothetical protein